MNRRKFRTRVESRYESIVTEEPVTEVLKTAAWVPAVPECRSVDSVEYVAYPLMTLSQPCGWVPVWMRTIQSPDCTACEQGDEKEYVAPELG